MKNTVRIGIIGEYDEKKTSHPATLEAIRHAAQRLALRARITWIATASCLSSDGTRQLQDYDGLWASSGSSQSREGMLKAIRWARESGKPFIGT